MKFCYLQILYSSASSHCHVPRHPCRCLGRACCAHARQHCSTPINCLSASAAAVNSTAQQLSPRRRRTPRSQASYEAYHEQQRTSFHRSAAANDALYRSLQPATTEIILNDASQSRPRDVAAVHKHCAPEAARSQALASGAGRSSVKLTSAAPHEPGPRPLLVRAAGTSAWPDAQLAATLSPSSAQPLGSTLSAHSHAVLQRLAGARQRSAVSRDGHRRAHAELGQRSHAPTGAACVQTGPQRTVPLQQLRDALPRPVAASVTTATRFAHQRRRDKVDHPALQNGARELRDSRIRHNCQQTAQCPRASTGSEHETPVSEQVLHARPRPAIGL